MEWALLAAKTANPPCSPADRVAQQLQGHVGTGAPKRRFDYNSIVISLYGLLEQFVEALVRGYTNRLNDLVPDYIALPEALRNGHLELSLTLLNRLESSRFRATITREDVIANLHSCLSNAKPYRLNAEAFAYHSANFRVEVIDAAFSRVGFPSLSQRLHYYPPFAEYLAQIFPGVDTQRLKLEEIYAILNDLADRRNEVAHGQPSELLSNEILLDYVAYIRAYSTALHEAVYCDALLIEARLRAVTLGAPIAVYDNKIVCVELKDTPIKVGDVLMAETGFSMRPVVAGEILELQINKTAVHDVPASASVKIGARVDFHAKENYSYFLLPTHHAA
jgi:hypothetical protein